MPIPQEILSVQRPPSTRVKKSGSRYLVIKRTCKRVDGRNVPVELGTIGEIVDGEYREIRKAPRAKVMDVKDYDTLRLCDEAGSPVHGQMKGIWDEDKGKRLYVMALLKSCYPGLSLGDMQWRYDTSFASEIYPGVDLSAEKMPSFMSGISPSSVRDFMKRRVEDNKGAPVVLDGMLSTHVEQMGFSEFRREGTNIPQGVLYAFNPVSREPLASRPYSGGLPGADTFRDFMKGCGISGGMMILDKEFPLLKGKDPFSDMGELSSLVPLQMSSALVARYGMDNPSQKLQGYGGGTVLYKKIRTPGGVYLYSFRDAWPTGEQIMGCLCTDTGKSLFGLVILRTKKDYPPLLVYQAYIQRRDIEMLLSQGTDDGTLGEDGREGAHLVTFLSCVISMRLKRMFVDKGLSCDYSFRQIMDLLSTGRMVRSSVEGKWTAASSPPEATEIRGALGRDAEGG